MDGMIVQLVQGRRENKKIELDKPDPLIEKFKAATQQGNQQAALIENLLLKFSALINPFQ